LNVYESKWFIWVSEKGLNAEVNVFTFKRGDSIYGTMITI